MGWFGFGKKRRAVKPGELRALLFDTFGTTVDWFGSMTAHAERLGGERGIDADWAGLVKEWRAHYKPAIKPVREGRRKWTGFDELHREELDKVVARYGARRLTPADRDRLTHGWHQLHAWPDAANALHRLKRHYIVGPLSNGTTRQMVDLARYASLPWDVVFGADMFRSYKPDRKLYLDAAKYLNLEPGQVLMVAAHNEDLQAAAKLGLRTCFVRRPTEDQSPTGTYDFVADDFVHLWGLLAVV